MSPEATFCLGLTVFPAALGLFAFIDSFFEERPKYPPTRRRLSEMAEEVR